MSELATEALGEEVEEKPVKRASKPKTMAIKTVKNIYVNQSDISLKEKVKYEYQVRHRGVDGKIKSKTVQATADRRDSGAYFVIKENGQEFKVVSAPDSNGTVRVCAGTSIGLPKSVVKEFSKNRCVEWDLDDED